MALIRDYATIDELKDYRRITSGDTLDDVTLQVAVTAASRAIDTYCDRHFGQDDAPVARLYSWSGQYLEVQTPDYRVGYTLNTPSTWAGRLVTLEIDDVATVTGLTVTTDSDGDGTYETTLVINTDFRLWPLNALADSDVYTRLVLPQGAVFPWSIAGVKVTASFGWLAVPDEIHEACLLQANRLCGRRDSWSGVAGSPELGNELRLLSKLDPDIGPLIAGRRRLWVAG